MRHSSTSHAAAASRPPGGVNNSLTVGELAHELNSILDGSLRYLAMAQESLRRMPVNEAAMVQDATTKLRSAQQGMTQMVALLQRSMQNRGATNMAVFLESQCIGPEVERIKTILKPLASHHGVAVSTSIEPQLARLPVATLGPVILNGLRNAIQACAAAEDGDRRVELTFELMDKAAIRMTINDTGQGVPASTKPLPVAKEGSHGLGLELCRRIIEDLCGEMSLYQRDSGRGATFQVVIPVRSLIQNG